MQTRAHNVDVHGRRVAASQLPKAANGTTCYKQLCFACRPDAPASTDLTRFTGNRARRSAMKPLIGKLGAK